MAEVIKASGANGTLRDRYRSEVSAPNYARRVVQRRPISLIADVHPQPSTFRSNGKAVMRFRSSRPSVSPLASHVSPVVIKQAPPTKGGNTIAHAFENIPQKRKMSRILSRLRPKNKLQFFSTSLAVIMIVGGAYFSILGWHYNHIAVAQAAKLTQQANRATAVIGTHASALSTNKPSTATMASYMVPPTLPRYIIIPKLGVDARVLSVGINSQGALETPNNVYDTAWYNGSAGPGQQGAMLIDGHVSSWTTHGVFYGIKNLVANDIIKVERGDGTIYSYKVVKSHVFKSGNVNMVSAMTPVMAGHPGLNLITCTGDVIPGTSDFNERIVVYATLQ